MCGKKITGIVVLLFLINTLLIGQGIPKQYTSANKKAIKHLQEAEIAYQFKRDAEAEKNFLKALKEDPNFIEACLGLANLYQVTNKHPDAISYFKRAISVNPKFSAKTFYFLSLSYLTLAQYQEAKTNLETYLSFERLNPDTKSDAQRLLANAIFGANALKNPKSYNLINAGPGINTELNEYFSAITGDANQFLFTRELRNKQYPEIINEDFFISNKIGGAWQTARPIAEINSMGNEGAPTLSVDGNIMFFASCADDFGDYGSQDRKGYGSCDIFYSQKVNGRWTKPRNAGPAINTNHWETQPSFSSDGRTLYFIRGLRGRGMDIKEQDIYTSTIDDNGKFTTAVKITTVVNSPYREASVFIHPDNQTLYFSSEGHTNMGSFDLFMSKRLPNGDWGTPINLGYPINTVNEESSLLVDPAGKLAYISSDRKGGFGGLDIYQFELPAELRPNKITYVVGKVINAKTKEPLEASFELIDLETQQQITQSFTQKNGEFFVPLVSNKNYMVNVNKTSYLFYSDNFSLKGKEADFEKPYRLEILLEPIDTGRVVELKNVFFDVNKWDLKPESKAELNKLVSFLVKNPTIKIEIGGHTDNTGDKKANQLLSANRAKSVLDYIVTNGSIPLSRLSSKGYGDTRPRVANDTPENKAKNRRTEFIVTAK